MQQGVLAFKYEWERESTGMTALAGLPVYLELAQVAGLPQSIQRHVQLRAGRPGWDDRQMVLALVLLNLAGGDAVQDLAVLEGDAGFGQLMRRMEHGRLTWSRRRVLERRWRRERRRSFPSPSAVFRYLALFHREGEEGHGRKGEALIPEPTEGLRSLERVDGDLLAFIQGKRPQEQATLDMDATLIETAKAEALFCYQGYKAYQPLTTYWVEQGVVLHSEFRDGNVPAGHEQLRVLKEALALVPLGVTRVRLRSDTAGYQQELLRYCAEGQNERFGIIEFAVGVDVTPQFQQAVAQTAEAEWHPLEREVAGKKVPTGQEWAEVCFVPNWIGHRKGSAEYRYLAIREPLRQAVLPGLEEQLPFSTITGGDGGRYKVTGTVTNRALAGDKVIWWSRERCGQGEEVHAIMKNDLAGGKLPSGDFGENAAWWAITVLGFNLHRAMQRLVLGTSWAGKRLKAMRFSLMALPGRVVHHARGLVLRLSSHHPSFRVLLECRQRIVALAHGPPLNPA